jgi:membrane protease YdiL (CAAX protease family)
MKVGRTFSRSWQRLFWLLPLLPPVIVTDLTAILWLGGTALVLVFVKNSRAPTFAFVYRNWWTSVGIVVIPLAEKMTGSPMDLSQFAAVQGDAGEFMTLLIVALVFGGIIEEICFRGYFIGWGAALYGARSALPLVLVISTVFGIGHWYQGPSGAIVTGVGSVVFGLVYVATGCKLLPAIATHMTSNFFGVLDLYLYGP